MIYLLRRFSAFLLSFFFCLTFLVPSALADDGFTSSGGSDFDNDYGVRWSGYVDDGSKTGVLAKAPDMWSAAVYACGGNPGLLSAEVRSKLSDPNYGGRFYAYAQSFGHIMSVSEIPSWVPLYILAAEGIANVWHGEFGDMLLWSSEVPNSLISGALIDFRRVLDGEDTGGGSIDVPEGEQVIALQSFGLHGINGHGTNELMRLLAHYGTYTDGQVITNGQTRYVSAWHNSYYVSSARAYVSHDAIQIAYDYLNSGYDVVFNLQFDGFNGNYFSGVIGEIIYGHDLSYSSHVNNVANTSYLLVSGSDLYCVKFPVRRNMYYDSSGCFSFIDGTPSDPVSLGDSYGAQMFSSPIYGVDNPLPDGQWPVSPDPSVPAEPEFPGPAEPTATPEPTVTTPTPTWPNINITVNPPAVVAPVTPDGLDYTELLMRINDNLNSINSYVVAVNSSLNSLRSDLVTEFGSVVQSLRNIYGYLQHMDSVLEVHCVHIRNKIEESAVFIANYMRSLVHWLAEQLDYDQTYGTDSYDDSLLTTINEKLGGGTYEPNPIKDEQGYYQWLDDLWDRFLLGDNWQSSMGSISGSFNELKTRFPFSIPWDVVALFRLFVHDPVTPVFDLPLYFSSDGSTPVHVDLTPWDSVAAVVRPLVFVIFALKLALLSRDLLGGLGADKGGL